MFKTFRNWVQVSSQYYHTIINMNFIYIVVENKGKFVQIVLKRLTFFFYYYFCLWLCKEGGLFGNVVKIIFFKMY